MHAGALGDRRILEGRGRLAAEGGGTLGIPRARTAERKPAHTVRDAVGARIGAEVAIERLVLLEDDDHVLDGRVRARSAALCPNARRAEERRQSDREGNALHGLTS